jgi:hypothetical protein
VNISPVIRDLLLRNQQAVIPGFGTFMIIQRPAQLNKITRVLTPPVKLIRFDKNLQNDDGQLSGYLIVKLKQDKEVVVKAIDAYVKHLRDTITDKGTVLLVGLGNLTKKPSGDMEFTPEDELQKRISLFDLPKINIPAPPVEKKEAVLLQSPPSAPAVKSKKRRLWWIPASILLVLLALAGLVYSTGNADQLMADVKNLFVEQDVKEPERIVFGSKTVADSSVQKDTLREEISRKLDEKVDRAKVLAFEESQTPKSEPKASPVILDEKPSFTNKSFHIIAGAFNVPNNAERLKNSLEKQGLTAEVLPKWGEYFLVSLGSFDSYDEAIVQMRQYNTRLNKELWVMKRR